MKNRSADPVSNSVAASLAGRGFDFGEALHAAFKAQTEVPQLAVLTEEELIDRWHEREYGYPSLRGLSGVDYSGILDIFGDADRGRRQH